MVGVDKKDRDVLRFLWTSELDSDILKPLKVRFTRVVFRVSSSPFLLNVTINHHIESYRHGSFLLSQVPILHLC